MLKREEFCPGHPFLQEDGVFKLSQDSVLLAGFTQVKKGEKIIDLGCGMGCLLLMLLLRENTCTALGVELMERAAELARENIALNGLQTRAEIINDDMLSLPSRFIEEFDLAVCNPPYFEPGRGVESPDKGKAAAKSQGYAPLPQVCQAASRLLRFGGRACFCFPPEGMAELFSAFQSSHLTPKKMRLVHSSSDKAPCLVLLEGKKGGRPGLKVMPPLIIESGGKKTEEFLSMYCFGEE